MTPQMFQAADVLELTGLTSHQLRRWSTRRALVPPDVKPSGRGRHALYSWETVVVLRLLKELHDRFAVEICAWSKGMTELRSVLEGVPFPSLWGKAVHFERIDLPVLVSAREAEVLAGIVLPLDTHLSLLAMKLCLGEADRRKLYPALAVS